MLDEQLMPHGLDVDENLLRWPNFNLNNRHDFKRKLNRIKPALVVIDSLAGCTKGVDENKREISDSLYWLETRNGVDFPATCFIILHHDNKHGQFRGHSSIRDAVSEVWHIVKPTDQEADENAYGDNTENKRIITVGKSRFDRGGAKFVSTQHEDFTMGFEDWTPCERVMRGGRVPLIDRVLRFVRDQTDQGASVTMQEIVNAMGTKLPTIKTCIRRLSQRDLILSFDLPREPGQRGQAKKAFVSNSEIGVRLAGIDLTENTASRGESELCVKYYPNPLQGNESENVSPTSESSDDTFNEPVSSDAISVATETDPASSPLMVHTEESDEVEPFTNPVPTTDLERVSDPGTHPAHAHAQEPDSDQHDEDPFDVANDTVLGD